MLGRTLATMTRQTLPLILITLIAGVVAAPSFARAAVQDPRPSREFTHCLKSAKGMRAMQHCDSQEVDVQQRALDREFAALAKARPRDHARLEADEAAWGERKDVKCLLFSRRRGSLNSLKAMDCFRDEIMARRQELQNYRPRRP